jgi:hypothetical protein
VADRYHINPETGDPGLCRAKQQCRFGDFESHYATADEARLEFEKSMASATFTPVVPERFFHVTSATNFERIEREGLTPMIGERSEALNELAERVYLFDSRESAYDGVASWLGDEFDEDEELVLLSLPASAVARPIPSMPDQESSFEWTTDQPVTASSIHVEPDRL